MSADDHLFQDEVSLMEIKYEVELTDIAKVTI